MHVSDQSSSSQFRRNRHEISQVMSFFSEPLGCRGSLGVDIEHLPAWVGFIVFVPSPG